MIERVQKAVNYINDRIPQTPDFAIVLGSGLKKIVDEVTDKIVIPYSEIPHFPISTVQGHGGDLIFGTIENKKVLIMSGRFHYYEGYDMQTVTFPIRVFGVMGIKNVILSNAAGGVDLAHRVGDVMLINDHINFMPEHPLRGKNGRNAENLFYQMHKDDGCDSGANGHIDAGGNQCLIEILKAHAVAEQEHYSNGCGNGANCGKNAVDNLHAVANAGKRNNGHQQHRKNSNGCCKIISVEYSENSGGKYGECNADFCTIENSGHYGCKSERIEPHEINTFGNDCASRFSNGAQYIMNHGKGG